MEEKQIHLVEINGGKLKVTSWYDLAALQEEIPEYFEREIVPKVNRGEVLLFDGDRLKLIPKQIVVTAWEAKKVED